MTPVTERFVLRVTAPAESDTCILPNEAAARSAKPHMTSHIERAVGTGINGCFLRCRFLRTAIQPLEVQCPRGTGHHHLGDLVRGCRIHLHPWPAFGLEDFRQTTKTVPGVDAQPRLPQNGDLAVAVDALHASPLAFFILVGDFVLWFQI
jgi:hypothetical protein